MKIAFSALSGRVVKSFSFKNAFDPLTYIVAARQTSDEDIDLHVYLLKPLGNAFQIVWKSERVFSIQYLEVVDLNRDGLHEIAWSDWSGGTGASLTTHHLFDPKLTKQTIIHEAQAWMDRQNPGTEIEIQPDGDWSCPVNTVPLTN